ncbi:3-deoxy-manno-octulosonate cytidylyltransferase [Akkermansiaceae bacterium]|nr:3-deoxy-manno-octulosonate cytidylyltransferase [Akkermansiaceae bacterium]
MNQKDYIVVIPARYDSTRLPGKPLVNIAGKPMIQRVYEQCTKAVDSDLVFVATDDQRIRSACESFGAKVVMTSSECLTGTDRVAEVSRKIDVRYYINVQGDEPFFNPTDITLLVDQLNFEEDEIVMGYCSIHSKADFENRAIPKMIFSEHNQLLYMSRSPIPGNKRDEFTSAWRQVCAYAFPKASLEVFSSINSKTPIEEIEDLEMLRFLEKGVSIKVVEMSSESIAVDHPEDVEKALKRLEYEAQ